MGIKYYTHFVMDEKLPRLSEFTGVVELSRAPRRNDMKAVAAILARNFDVDSEHIRVLHWSRLH